MKYQIDAASARIIMRGLIWAMEDAEATEVEVAEYQIEWYQIGEAFGLLDEDQLDEMDGQVGTCLEIIAEHIFEAGYQRSSVSIRG
jgi:hypothetical protein